MDTQKKIYSGTYIVVAAVICLVVGFGIGWYSSQAQLKSKGIENIENEDEQATTTVKVDIENLGNLAAVGTVSLGESDDIEVENQAAGQTVSVKSVSLGQTTWLAVRDNNNGVLGNILGAKRLEIGKHTDVKIELLRPTLAEKSYFVVLYADDGDLAFDYKKDKLMESEGKPFAVSFNAN